MTKYNVIVIGAGPSGATAAYHLARGGAETLLIDSKKLPRFKACGGGVSKKLVDSLPVDVSCAVKGATFGIKLFNSNLTDPAEVRLKSPILMMDRALFDHQLVKAAEGAGTDVLDANRALHIQELDTGIELETEKGSFSCDHIILADGVNDPVGRKLGFRKNETIFALELELPNFPADPSSTYWGRMPINQGFAWVFPKQDRASVGILGMDSGAKLKEELHNWIKLWGYQGEIGQIHGHPIPLIDFTKTLQSDRALLVGDAAGLADPLTGEGIKFAIMSGRIAAETILSGQVPSYSRRIALEIYPYFAFSSMFRFFVYRWTDFFYKHGVANPLVQQAIVQIFDQVK